MLATLAGRLNLHLEHRDARQRPSKAPSATMPNGQKYEDWLKSKGSGE
jgi:hypothetical protein